MTVTEHTTDQPVLRSAYQRSVAEYWNNEKDPVNIRLGEVDGGWQELHPAAHRSDGSKVAGQQRPFERTFPGEQGDLRADPEQPQSPRGNQFSREQTG